MKTSLTVDHQDENVEESEDQNVSVSQKITQEKEQQECYRSNKHYKSVIFSKRKSVVTPDIDKMKPYSLFSYITQVGTFSKYKRFNDEKDKESMRD